MNGLFVVAEVMDKEPTIAEIWKFAICASVIIFVLSVTLRTIVGKRALIAVIPISLMLAYATIGETWDPYVGPAIREEAGDGYILQCHLAAVSIVAAGLTGNLTARLLRQHWVSMNGATARMT